MEIWTELEQNSKEFIYIRARVLTFNSCGDCFSVGEDPDMKS